MALGRATGASWCWVKGIPRFRADAAGEMRERVGGLLEGRQGKGLTISTFHSLCVRILRRNIERMSRN